MKSRSGIGLMLAVLLLLSQIVSVEAAANPNPNIAPANSSAYGKTYGEWADNWWQWVLTLRSPDDPFNSTECVKTNNTGNVFFLTGTLGTGDATRSCVIPTGTPLFFPIINIAWFENPALYYDPKFDPPYTPARIVDFLRNEAFAPDKVSLEAMIDGVPVKSLQNSTNYLVTTDPKKPFQSDILPGNLLFNITEPLYWVGLNGGYYLLLHPLTPGSHTIEFTGKIIAPSSLTIPAEAGGSFNLDKFTTHLKYNITVVAGHK